LDKISLEIELLVLDPFEKDRSALVPIPHTLISLIQNNLPTYFSSPSLSYKSTSFPSISESKKPIVEIENDNDIDSDVEIQLLSPQQSLQPTLQTLQEGLELIRSKHQTQMPFRKGNIYREQEYSTNIL